MLAIGHPCRIPLVFSIRSPSLPLRIILASLDWYKVAVHSSIKVGKPILRITFNKKLLFTRSKAFSKSKAIMAPLLLEA